MEKLKIGTIINSFGIKGECKVKSFSDFNEERFAVGSIVQCEYQNRDVSLEIESMREHKGVLLIRFKGYSNINDIEKFKGCDLTIKKDQLHALNEGEYYFFELKDMKVVDQNGDEIGIVLQVEEGLAHNLLRVKKSDNTTGLIPFHPAFIIRVDKLKKIIVVKMMEGLL